MEKIISANVPSKALTVLKRIIQKNIIYSE